MHLPDGAGESGRWCARPRWAGIPPQPASAGPHFHCATGFCLHPLTRACVRLLGPCFKTGRVGCRHVHRSLVPFTWAEPRPGGTTRLGRTEESLLRSILDAPWCILLRVRGGSMRKDAMALVFFILWNKLTNYRLTIISTNIDNNN